MKIEGESNGLTKREIVSFLKEYDELDAQKAEASHPEGRMDEIDRRLAELEPIIKEQEMDFTGEQWALIQRWANHESGLDGFVEGKVHGNYEPDEQEAIQKSYEEEKRQLTKKWKEVFDEELPA